MSYGFPIVEKFIALQAPAQNPFGWYVMTEETTIDKLYFLATDGNVRIRDKTTGFFFDTEMNALFASAGYYNKNLGRSYPYIDRLIEVTDNE